MMVGGVPGVAPAAKQAGAYLESALRLQAQEIAATAAGLVQQTHGLSASAKVQAELTGQGLADIVASFEDAAQRQAILCDNVAELYGIDIDALT